MSHNPKLNVYTLQLNPQDDSVQTFRDLFKCKYNKDASVSDNELFKKYFEDFVNGIGDKDFRKDSKNKKVIGKVNSSSVSVPLRPTNDACIDGVIEGGKYGIRREFADTNDKSHKNIISENNAVLDQYYIMVYTPLNSQFGFLLIQSYTEETVQDSIKNFIRTFFSCENNFYNIRIEPYVPQKVIEKYMNASKISMFGFTTKTSLSESLRNDKQIKGQTFEVEIRIKPLESSINPYSEEASQIFDAISEKVFDGRQLKEGQGKAYVIDDKKRRAHYDMERDLKENVRPTIYLEDAGVTCDENTGIPDFKAIQTYCVEILEEIKQEFNKQTEIHEF